MNQSKLQRGLELASLLINLEPSFIEID